MRQVAWTQLSWGCNDIRSIGRPAHRALGIGNVDEHGFVLDFGILKPIIKSVVDLVDHRYIVSDSNFDEADPYYEAAVAADRTEDIVLLAIHESSAELLSLWFKNAIQQALADDGYLDIAVMEVQLWETNKAYATC